MLGLLALYWLMAAGVAVVTDRLWASKISPYLGCSLMHGVVAAIIGAHIVLNKLVLNGHLAIWPSGLRFQAPMLALSSL